MAVVPVEIPKGSNRWLIRIRWQFSPGKRWRKTKLIGAGDKAKDAAFERARLLNEAWTKFGADAVKLVEPDLPERPKPITIAEYAPTFLARMRCSGLKRSTLAMYQSNLKHHILPELGKADLAAINYKCVADFLSAKASATYSTGRYRVERPPYKRNFSKSRPVPKHHDYPEALDRHYSRDSIRIMVMTLRALMGEATKDQIVPVNPITGMSRFYRRRRKDREVRRSDVFTAEELHAIEDHLAEGCPEYFELSLAMSREGIRIGEAMALTVHDIDWQRGTILINKNVPAGIGRLEDSTKTEPSDREIEFWSEDFKACPGDNAKTTPAGVDCKRKASARVFVLRALWSHDQLFQIRESLEPCPEVGRSQTEVASLTASLLGESPDRRRRGHCIGLETPWTRKPRRDPGNLHALLTEEPAAHRNGFGSPKGNYEATERGLKVSAQSEKTVSYCIYWSQRPDLNRRPTDYESVALPTELRWLDVVKERLARRRAGIKSSSNRLVGLLVFPGKHILASARFPQFP